MTKLKSFVKLDFVTVKPYFTFKTMLIYVLCALFLTTVSENVASGIGVGMMLGTMFIGYPFALGEKSNMDALYATLSVDRKTVVLGRYIFALLLNVCTIMFSLVLATVGLFAAKSFDFETGVGSSFVVVVSLSTLFIVIQSIQLPLYFKFGYSKAKFLSIVPFVAIMVGYLVFMSMANVSSDLSEFLTKLFANVEIVILLILTVLIFFVFISYNLSFAFYKKREF